MNTTNHVIEVQTRGAGLHDVTAEVRDWLGRQSVTQGLLTIVCRHTGASLMIQGGEADMKVDLEAFFDRIAPQVASLYSHTQDGPDDMPAHIRAALTQAQLTLPVIDGSLAIGRSQAIYLFEHRQAPHARQALLHLAW
ncbi:secondary thiamine-phosphate synthase enzyme YjbQ [Phenylobacterium sp. 58.2.17]|jgi:secondary thiamine-phosphate synthase enzyme|uniref:secondary thiamine-phosphate synthase enzyme YjbQ n=1 Tax=Phenylobacterium sp. 58.2.17 TaxID=2969306 RepID=UPI0022655CBC|nr:secondary thiamine-phosphate synthase enzyme YjbQ [Phenylobacterium sp. 58.2.17]MCX7586328.1 secondary thiamine-phosphate synthase enzyme YjbQ [Phenylobacterium sp. 58.2.17]